MKPNLTLLLLSLLLALPVLADMDGSGRKGMGGGGFGGGGEGGGGGKRMMRGDGEGISSGGVERREMNIVASGLSVAFPEGYSCDPIASPYASPTRYDGSSRRDDRNGGLHGGMDLSLTEGTPLLAVADGEVIHKGAGGRLEGNYLWLRFAPEATGLPYWVFTKYQHLSEVPTLNPGDRVKAGQVVASSGDSGTAGGHFVSGYPHLHMSTFYGSSGDFEIGGMFGSMVRGKDAASDDPLVLYTQGIKAISEVRELPEAQRTVHPGIVTGDGSILPQGSRIVWPVACKRAG